MDGSRLGDEGKNLHLPTAVRTGQRVDIINPVNELGPSFAQSAAGRSGLARLSRWLAVSEGGAHAVGVGAVEMDEVLVGFGNVDEDSGEKLEWVRQRLVIGVMP